ncbi:hypothetical protein P3T27_000445 [Kitasatospora sp. MAA19]|nr:hypothetical protein [Kitasatospora sp. MAA19]
MNLALWIVAGLLASTSRPSTLTGRPVRAHTTQPTPEGLSPQNRPIRC